MIMFQMQFNGLPQIDTSQILAVGGGVGLFIFVMIVIIAVTAIIMYLAKFNKPLYLLFKQGDAYRLKRDKGYDDIKNNTFKVLKFKQVLYDRPTSEQYYGEGKKDILIGIVENNSCTWLTITKEHCFKPADANLLAFQVEQYAKIDAATKVKEQWWDKYGHQVIWSITIVIFMLCVIFILQSVDKAIKMGAEVVSRLSGIISGLGYATNTTKNVQIVALPILTMLFRIKKKKVAKYD